MPITIVRPDERASQKVSDETPILLNVLSDGLEGNPYVHVTTVPANHHIATHSHSETEVTVILSGRARLGDAECGPGSVIVIPADEKYSLDSGDEALTFVVVRPRKASFEFSE